MAAAEAEITVNIPSCKDMNYQLASRFPHRTLESIKGKRRAAVYKTKVKTFVEGLRSPPAPVSSSGRANAPQSPSTETSSQISPKPQELAPSRTTRWSPDEITTMARAEARLLHGNPCCGNINQQIAAQFPTRTLDSIKAKRRTTKYREIVDNLLRNMGDDPPQVILIEPSDVEKANPRRCTTPSPPADDQHVSRTPLPVNHIETIRKYVSDLNSLHTLRPPPSSEELSLLDEALLAALASPDKAKDLSTLYLLPFLPIAESSNLHSHQSNRRVTCLSKRKQKRADYARLQSLYKRNRQAAAERIFKKTSLSPDLNTEDVFSFWTNLFTKTNLMDDVEESAAANMSNSITLFTPEEVTTNILKFSSAAGPDGLTVAASNKIPVRAKCKLFTLWLLMKWMPDCVSISRTIFIPKGPEVRRPSELRPISISSVLLRQMHKVLANRLSTMLNISDFQFGFRPLDGIAKGIKVLDSVLQFSKHQIKPLTIAVVDFEKAFDSISHSAIYNSLRQAGVEEGLISYLKFIYHNSKTVLTIRGQSSSPIHPSRGVRQGDPLSPVLFLLVLDNVLKSIPATEGFRVEQSWYNHVAYADDLVLMSSSRNGLQRILDSISPVLPPCGLKINTSKSFTISWTLDGKRKRLLYDEGATCTVFNQPLRSLQISETFNYLGVPFGVHGKIFQSTKQLEIMLPILQKAPLKPQQKLFILNKLLIPKFMHQLVLGKLHVGVLNKIDVRIRHFIRSILHLPHDLPKSAFYASAKDGGLGVTCLRWSVPIQARHRLHDFSARTTNILRSGARLITSNNRALGEFKRDLYEKCDGKGLTQASKVPVAHSWVTDGTSFLSGSDYINSVRLRYNCLYNKSRAARGRVKDKLCSRGCHLPETLNHILQQCHSTHGLRIKRHDAICSYLSRSFQQRGWTVHKEQKFQTPLGVLKPDLVAYNQDRVVVVDTQIVGDQVHLREAHNKKVHKYKSTIVNQLHGLRPGGVHFTSLTTNWRGCLAEDSAKDLVALGLLRKGDLRVISSRAIVGGVATWRAFQHMTASRVKKGIG